MIFRSENCEGTMDFRCFEEENYQAVCDFLIALNQQDKTHINWNWARWEWMYQHPYFERTLQDTIGLWWDDNRVVGAAIYDLYHGEAFCGAPSFRFMFRDKCNNLGQIAFQHGTQGVECIG